MAYLSKHKFRYWKIQQPLIAAALAVAGVFNMVSAVLAEGTAAGTDISNTATATYNDGNGNNFNATSNTVVIKVAEIAGLTVTARPILDADGGAIEAGDTLTFIFDVTNVGNAPTDVFVPGMGDLLTTNFTPSATNPVQVFEADGTTLIGTVPAGGGTLTNIKGSPVVINPDQKFVVKVTGTPAPGTVAGNTISVRLGDTTNNTDEGPDPTQNQRDNSDGAANITDLRTVDPTPAVATDDPENGEREAEATASGIFASSVRPLALATVLKTASVTSVGVPSDPTDDRITYNLGLRVENTSPSSLFQPAALEGTNITLNGSTQKRILVSDAIPAGTQLSSVSTSLPAGWTAVYTIATGNDPLALAWTTTPPTDLTTVKRVGFVFNGTIGATGTTLTGLRFTVVANGIPVTGGTVENIAQVFGQTVGDPATTPQVIYDESGDSRPNNFNDDNTLPDQGGDQSGSEYVPGTDTGIANAATNGTDTGNNNTGSGGKGEVNVVSLIPTTDDILNGTKDTPNAVGPTGDNDDFTNKSTPTPPPGTAPTETFDPAAVTFDNSLSNPATAGFIAATTIEPIRPSDAVTAAGVAAGTYGANSDIPDNTTVTITAGAQSATYTYTAAGGFVLTAGTRVNVGDVVAGTEVDYTVTVDLPLGTAQLDEVSIPIIAFADDDPVASPGYTGETTNNITIDRLYTGFMELIKEAQVLDATGTLRGPAFSTTPTVNAAPGEFIEYRIRYRNISQAATGPGSITLTANDFVITEDGNSTVPIQGADNNWAQFTTHQQNTVASTGKTYFYTNSGDATRAPGGATEADPSSGTVVEKYENAVPTVVPQATGSFIFRRMVD